MRIYISALIVSILIFIAHYFGIHLNWYVTLFGYDSIVHALGGAAIALCVLISRSFLPRRYSHSLQKLSSVIIGVVIIGIAWELFEIFYDLSVQPGQPYWPDTIKDIIMDVIGGWVAYWSAISSKNAQF